MTPVRPVAVNASLYVSPGLPTTPTPLKVATPKEGVAMLPMRRSLASRVEPSRKRVTEISYWLFVTRLLKESRISITG